MTRNTRINVGRFKIDLQEPNAASALGLSPRETEILVSLVTGLSVKEIAHRLSLSPHTIDIFKRRIFKKLGVHNAASAAALGVAVMTGAKVNDGTIETCASPESTPA